MAADDATQALLDAGLSLSAGRLQLGRGRKTKPLHVAVGRELTVDDLIRASEERGTKPAPLKSIRQTHHSIARLLATGTEQVEISRILGVHPSTISILKNDPAFQEILEYYTQMDKEAHQLATVSMHERLAAAGFDSLELLHQRLLEEPESFDNKTLLAVVEATADRTGHGKTSTVKHEHELSLSDHQIAEIKSASGMGRSQVAEENRGALLRIAAARTAPVHAEGEEGDWIEGTGTCIREESHKGIETFPGGGDQLPPLD